MWKKRLEKAERIKEAKLKRTGLTEKEFCDKYRNTVRALLLKAISSRTPIVRTRTNT